MYALLYFFHSKIIARNNYYMEGFIILKNDYFRQRFFFFVGMSNNSVKKLPKKGLDMFSKE